MSENKTKPCKNTYRRGTFIPWWNNKTVPAGVLWGCWAKWQKNPVTVIDAAHYWSHTDDHGPHLFSVIIDKSTINEPLCRPNYILTLFFTQTIGMFLWFLMCDYTQFPHDVWRKWVHAQFQYTIFMGKRRSSSMRWKRRQEMSTNYEVPLSILVRKLFWYEGKGE